MSSVSSRLRRPIMGNSNDLSTTTVPPKRHGRGFASMDPERVAQIASQGGKAAHAQGRAYTWDSQSAREAGLKGAAARRKNT